MKKKIKTTTSNNQNLKRIIKLTNIEEITAATRAGLDNAKLKEPSDKLFDVLNSRDKRLEESLTKLI